MKDTLDLLKYLLKSKYRFILRELRDYPDEFDDVFIKQEWDTYYIPKCITYCEEVIKIPHEFIFLDLYNNLYL